MNVKFIISLFNHLKSKYNINKLTTHNCTQDDVENFFSRMRSGGGNRFNPAAHEFLSEYRKITVDSLFTKVRGSNCNLDAGEFLLKLEQLQKCERPIPVVVNIPENITPIASFEQSNLFENAISVLAFEICEYVCKMFCKDCIGLVCNDSTSSFSSNILLLRDKTKNSDNRRQPSTLFLCYIRKLYIIFNCYQNDILHKDNLCKLFYNIVQVNRTNFVYCGICVIEEPVISYFVRRRLNVVLSKDNSDTVSSSKNGKTKYRKLLKLKHI